MAQINDKIPRATENLSVFYKQIWGGAFGRESRFRTTQAAEQTVSVGIYTSSNKDKHCSLRPATQPTQFLSSLTQQKQAYSVQHIPNLLFGYGGYGGCHLLNTNCVLDYNPVIMVFKIISRIQRSGEQMVVSGGNPLGRGNVRRRGKRMKGMVYLKEMTMARVNRHG